ncbi:alpha/beta fold hydrolase [Bradyrhizobium cenepequi]|uniref:alpha/beta fold hydrolase n=1 Tax=Bradyrhizobium cenepequi TaxID=2821403 RepID=UPI001CE25D96|nr:alpha/beta hydrolase [Bradyrhizobium cenepequi]MCA6111236.1 alpha/beta hydrolase [Bradyrhizobium cenepequi]
MSKLLPTVAAVALALGASISPAAAHDDADQSKMIGFVKLDEDITLRRKVIRSRRSKNVVLLLHGFPETLQTWEAVTTTLADEYEVHAFDWPGYGLSSRPSTDKFSYAPSDYARVVKEYVDKAGIDRTKLIIYATDIGALPALLAALDEPGIARKIVVGDFAPFDRPQYMHERLRDLKAPATSDQIRTQYYQNSDKVIENAFKGGLPREAQFPISTAFKQDMLKGWNQGSLTSGDAFYHYYSHFTRDENYLEANISRLTTPVKIVWGEKDIYINKEMGIELASKAKADFTLLTGIGHYAHLQDPARVAAEIRAAAQ